MFTRVSRGYCRNEKSPLRALTPTFLAFTAFAVASRNEKSPLRALTHVAELKANGRPFTVEMRKARLGH